MFVRLISSAMQSLCGQDTPNNTNKDQCRGYKAFKVCDVSKSRGGSAAADVPINSQQNQTATLDGGTLGNGLMPKIVEKKVSF